jgi:hypothetical protein
LSVCLLVFVLGLLVVGLALREALRSPEGGAFRAKRRARPTTRRGAQEQKPKRQTAKTERQTKTTRTQK